MPTLDDVVAALHSWYPPTTAEPWDAVGLVAGDPEAKVKKVMFAVDPTPEVAAEAVAWGADLLVVHHPLFLKPVHGFAAITPKGRTLHTLTKAGCALLTLHTNADQAEHGVSHALADAFGLTDLQPLRPTAAGPADKLIVYVPVDAAPPVRAAIAEAGAGHIGDYDFASFSSTGEGRFRPLEGANPTIGSVGDLEVVEEVKIEVVLERSRRAEVVRALLASHPYEEPAYQVLELADPGVTPGGIGRVGSVERTTLREFVQRVHDAVPATAQGVRVAGDPDRIVKRVAVCGGAGDSLLGDVLHTGVDVYVTSDLRHHPASEFIEQGGPALIDIAHWAAESLWLPVVEERLSVEFGEGRGDTVETTVSSASTDPWTFRVQGSGAPAADDRDDPATRGDE